MTLPLSGITQLTSQDVFGKMPTQSDMLNVQLSIGGNTQGTSGSQPSRVSCAVQLLK
jgi:hypothetical protein